MTSVTGESKVTVPEPYTLLVGGEARAGADHLAIEEVATSIPRPYREIFVQIPLDLLPDAYETLRVLWAWLADTGILTVLYRNTGSDRLRDTEVKALMRLTSFEVIGSKDVGALRRLRATPRSRPTTDMTCTVVVPCRNEVDNVATLVERVPSIGRETELVFVDGESSDGTADRIKALIERFPDRDIKLLHQSRPGGKATAVFQGFEAASGDVVMILDADMTVAPEDLPRFFLAIAEGVADFANGSRFGYPMQKGAMPPLNKVGNRLFGILLSWVLTSHITDSLCGTKAFERRHWPAIRDARHLFGEHDPWGDFDLLLGASYTGLRIIDVPVRYYARVAGESKMHPLRHGLYLARTCWAGMTQLKFRSPTAPEI